MSKAETKAKRERAVFRAFAGRSGLSIVSDSIGSRDDPEPDILCRIVGEGHVSFELKELCDEGIARTDSELIKSGSEEAVYLRPGDPTRRIVMAALKKKYKTDHPAELLLYTDGRIVGHPNVLIPHIQPILDNIRHDFRRVWFMGQPGETCECIFEQAEVSV